MGISRRIQGNLTQFLLYLASIEFKPLKITIKITIKKVSLMNKDEIIKIEILKPAEKSLTTFCFNY